jgi:hypothetical protein
VSGFDLFGDVTTVDTGERSDFDFYETAAFQVRSLVHHHPAIRGARVLECCSGRDAIARVLRDEYGCTVFTNDIDTRHPAETHFDATQAWYWREHAPAVDFVVTNPAFNVAFPILVHAVQHASEGTIFLVRKTFLEPTEERGPWLQEHPPSRAIGLPRYSFRGKGSDSVSADWFVWEKRPDRSLPPIVVDSDAERRTR